MALVMECVGFAGTRSLTALLETVPGLRVLHGTQNYHTGKGIGEDNQELEAFLDDMAAAESSDLRPIVIHTLYPPRKAFAACRERGIDYKLLVRDPRKQVESCYGWLYRQLCMGSASILEELNTLYYPSLKPSAVPATLANVAFACASFRVNKYNLNALSTGCEVVRMEDVLTDTAALKAAFDVAPHHAIELDTASHVETYSHKQWLKDAGMAEPDREAVFDVMRFTNGTASFHIDQIAAHLGYGQQVATDAA